MKVFLSSPVKGLRDVRLFLDQNLELICQNDIELVCYEKCAHTTPNLTAEDICLSLVRECKAFIIIIDQYYGTAFKKNPDISITHAELHEALSHDLNIIPLVRSQTWCEYQVWNRNPEVDIEYAHVMDPGVFDMLNEVGAYHCHIYDSFTDKEALKKIAETLDAIITKGAVGTIQHIALPSDTAEPAPSVPSTPESIFEDQFNSPCFEVYNSVDVEQPNPPIELTSFSTGQQVTADHINVIFKAVFDVAEYRGLQINPPTKWKNGDVIGADDFNKLINDIVLIYKHIQRNPPKWSFGVFKTGSAITAAYLNEIVDSVKALLEA